MDLQGDPIVEECSRCRQEKPLAVHMCGRSGCLDYCWDCLQTCMGDVYYNGGDEAFMDAVIDIAKKA